MSEQVNFVAIRDATIFICPLLFFRIINFSIVKIHDYSLAPVADFMKVSIKGLRVLCFSFNPFHQLTSV